MTRVGAVVTERRVWWLLAAVPTGVLGLLVAGLLSRPLGHPASDYPRVVALLAGMALLGTCMVVALEDSRRRSVLAARLSRWRMVLAHCGWSPSWCYWWRRRVRQAVVR